MSMTSLLLGSVASSFQVGGGGGGGTTGQIIGVTGHFAGRAGLDITYVGAPLGTPVAGRLLYIVCAFFDGATTDSFPSSVTVGGNAATRLAHAHKTGDNACGISVWAYRDDGALGSNADVVVAHPIGRNSRSLAVVEARAGGENLLASVGGADSTSSIVPSSLATENATALLYVSMFQNGFDPTAPAPFTDGQYTYDENTAEWVCIAWDNSPSGNPETVSIPTGGTSLRAAYLALALD